MNPFNTDDFSTPGGAFVPFTPGYVGSPGWLYQFSSGFDVQGARDGGVFSATNTNNYASYVISRVPSAPSYTVDGAFVYQAADAGNNKGTFAVAARFQADGSFYWAGFVSSGVTYTGLDPALNFKTKFIIGRQDLGLRATGNVQTALAAVDATGKFNLGDTRNFGLIVGGSLLTMTVDGSTVLQTTDNHYSSGGSGLFVVAYPKTVGQVFMQTFQYIDRSQGGGLLPGQGASGGFTIAPELLVLGAFGRGRNA